MSYDDEDDSERKREVGTRVQRYDGNVIVGGVIESVEPPQVPYDQRKYWSCTEEQRKQMTAHCHIKWDDGTTEYTELDHHDFEDTEMERAFRNAAPQALAEIKVQMAIASKAIREATAIADKYGIPFRASVSPLKQSYFPDTTESIYGKLHNEFVANITGSWHSEYGDVGWQHSAVC